MTIEMINNNMEIKNINGKKFACNDGYYMGSKKESAFFVKGKGFVSFDGIYPYCPAGGEKSLELIIQGGGFNSFKGMSFVNPLNQ